MKCNFLIVGQQTHTLTLPHQSPGDSPTQSCQSSPTVSMRRPRARSVDTDPNKKEVSFRNPIYKTWQAAVVDILLQTGVNE